jgi:hypothetical protein
VNATRRSVNRTMAALGALAAGLVVGLIGDRPTLIGVIIVFAAAALTAALSPLREASNQDAIKALTSDPAKSGAISVCSLANGAAPGRWREGTRSFELMFLDFFERSRDFALKGRLTLGSGQPISLERYARLTVRVWTRTVSAVGLPG